MSLQDNLNIIKEKDLMEEYRRLDDQCDALINKIKNRKQHKLALEQHDRQQK
jgi:hypothetical protein